MALTRLASLLACAWLVLGLAPAIAAAQVAAPPVPAVAPAQTPTPVSAAEADTYRLGPGDKLRVITYGEPELTGEFFVGSSGIVSLPLIGDVQATSRTVNDVRGAIEEKLRDGYLKEPRVSIEVLTYRPFYILGEVNKPGEYPYTSGLTVLNAVATATGFTYRANSKVVFIKRAGATAEVKTPLTTATEVHPGDTIRIGERLF